MSDIAISSRSCTERHGDFSESVVCFTLLTRCPVFCLFFGWAFGFLFLLFVCVGCCLVVGWETP